MVTAAAKAQHKPSAKWQCTRSRGPIAAAMDLLWVDDICARPSPPLVAHHRLWLPRTPPPFANEGRQGLPERRKNYCLQQTAEMDYLEHHSVAERWHTARRDLSAAAHVLHGASVRLQPPPGRAAVAAPPTSMRSFVPHPFSVF